MSANINLPISGLWGKESHMHLFILLTFIFYQFTAYVRMGPYEQVRLTIIDSLVIQIILITCSIY